jgi:hypothetical protein
MSVSCLRVWVLVLVYGLYGAVLLVSGGAEAATVRPGDSVTNALSQLRGGETLEFESGTYTECINDTIPSGSSGSPTVLKSKVPGWAVFKPSCHAGDGVALIMIGLRGQRSWIRLDGFVIDGSSASAPSSGVTVRSPSHDGSNATHNITLENLEIKNLKWVDDPNGTSGMSIAAGTHTLTLRGNHIHDIGMEASSSAQFLSYCIYWAGSNSLVEKNHLHHCSGYGIHGFSNLSVGAGGTGGSTIRDNFIHDNGAIGILSCTANNKLYGNIIANNGWHRRDPGGLQLGGYCSGVQANNNQVYNNTLYGNKPYAIRLGISGSGSANNNVVQNNLLWQNGSDTISVSNGSGNTLDMNLMGTDPKFVNAGSGDFRLAAGSPAIDKGKNMGLSYTGSAPDMGACEFGMPTCGGGGSQSPPPALPAPQNLRVLNQ